MSNLSPLVDISYLNRLFWPFNFERQHSSRKPSASPFCSSSFHDNSACSCDRFAFKIIKSNSPKLTARTELACQSLRSFTSNDIFTSIERSKWCTEWNCRWCLKGKLQKFSNKQDFSLFSRFRWAAEWKLSNKWVNFYRFFYFQILHCRWRKAHKSSTKAHKTFCTLNRKVLEFLCRKTKISLSHRSQKHFHRFSLLCSRFV